MKDSLSTISLRWDAETGIKTRRAPSGKLFALHGFGFMNRGDISDTFLVTNRLIEDRAAFTTSEEFIYAMHLNISSVDETHYFYHVKPILTKYLSMGAIKIASAMTCFLIIYYELVDASKTDLIWEFVKRGKNP